MSHHHHHEDHHHHHSNDKPSSRTLTTEEKLATLLDHWVQHNHDHAKTYRDWGSRAQAEKLDEVAHLLEEAARMTDKISAVFNTAADALKSKS